MAAASPPHCEAVNGPSNESSVSPERAASSLPKSIENLKKDKDIPDQERKTLIDELKEAIKTTPDVEHKENIALVKKHLKKIEQAIN